MKPLGTPPTSALPDDVGAAAASGSGESLGSQPTSDATTVRSAEPATRPTEAASTPGGGAGFGLRLLRFVGRLVVQLAVLAAMGVGAYFYYEKIYLPTTKPPAAPPKRPATVAVAAVRRGDLNQYLNGLGTVTAFNIVTVRSRVDGELVDVAFTEGQHVKQGDLLAEIDPRPYQVQLEQAEGPLARDRAALEIARTTLERYQQLAKNNAISQQEIDTQASLVKQTEAAIQTDLAQINDAKLQLEFCRITSPITGRIGLRIVDRGNIVHASDANGLAVVTQMQPIAVIFTVPQDEIARIRKRMLADSALSVEAYNRDFSVKLATGKLAALDNQVDATTGTVRLKAVFENADEMLFPNQFVNVRLLVDVSRDVVLAPGAAVQRGPSFMFAYVLSNDSTVELRKIVCGPTEGTDIVVLEGLESGERVVTDGLDKLQPGAAVSVRDPNKKPSGEKSGDRSDKADSRDSGDKQAPR